MLDRIRRDLDRNALRLRNGLKHLAGVGLPDTAMTPKELVWSRDKVQLNHYLSDTPKASPPVLLVMSLVSKGYILDLRPGNSFIEALMAHGLDVYALDWGVPDAADAENSFETYCDEYLPLATEEVLADSGADELIVYGYCFGAVLSLLFLAGHPEVPLRAFGIMATPIDFKQLGTTNRMFAEGRIDPDDLVDETGNVPPHYVLDGMKTLNITSDVVGYANLLNRLDDSEYIAAHQALIGWSQVGVADQIGRDVQCLHPVEHVVRRDVAGLVDQVLRVDPALANMRLVVPSCLKSIGVAMIPNDRSGTLRVAGRKSNDSTAPKQ